MAAADPRDVCARAADLVERGWMQGDYWNAHGTRCCLVGALDEAAKDDRVFDEACRLVRTIIGSELDAWNDTPGRTQAEVVAALRQAARS